jgi:tetratricopeptide (TPR) repeat protein
MAEPEDSFEIRVSRLVNYLTRACKYNKSSILFALYRSEFLRSDVEKRLRHNLKKHNLDVIDVDANINKNKDLPSFFSSMNSKNSVFFVHSIKKGFSESLDFLNFKREELVDDHIKAVFWVTEEELARISIEAPDFFAFRNRVVEFMEIPSSAPELRPAFIDSALDTDYKSITEIKHGIELKKKILSELSDDNEIKGYLLGSLGVLHYQISLYDKAIEYFHEALDIFREIGNRRREGNNLENLGTAYRDIGDLNKAIKYHHEALNISREIKDRRAECGCIGNLGVDYSYLGDISKAIEYYHEALKISREIGDKYGEGTNLGNLGSAYSELGNINKAIDYYHEALDIFREIGNLRAEDTHLGNLGNIYSYLGNLDKGIEYYHQALDISREIGDRRGEGTHLLNLGSAYNDQKMYADALAFFIVAGNIFAEIKSPYIETINSNLKRLEEEIGKTEFEKLMAEVAPKAEEIVRKLT